MPKAAFSTGLHHFMGRAQTGKKVPVLYGTVMHHGFIHPLSTDVAGSAHRSTKRARPIRRNSALFSARNTCLRSPHGITGRLKITFVSVGGVARSLIRKLKPMRSGGLFV